MNDWTFLTDEQIYGDKQLEILRKYGLRCDITDFSILLGSHVSDGAGIWWGKTASDYDNGARIIFPDGDIHFANPQQRQVGARPAIPYSSIFSFCSNAVINKSGILEVEYGELPHYIAPFLDSQALDRAYLYGKLRETGKGYTTDSVALIDGNTPFRARRHIEYEYNGKKYIRFVGDINGASRMLSDGSVVIPNHVYWIQVLPIKWLVDEKADIALSKNIIFSGVQFESSGIYDGDFNKTTMKRFMNTDFQRDIMPMKSNPLNMTPIVSNTTNITIDNQEQIEEKQIQVEKRINPYGFNFDNVSEEDIIRGAIESGVAVFLHGKSSEGKSARVKQIDPNLVIIYLRNATPESLNGKSVYNAETGEMIDIKPTWLKKLEERCEKEPDQYHIVFFDEITNALPSIQGIAFNIVLDREVNGIWQLPENARIVAAGNEMKDSLAANQLAEPLFNRFAHVYINTTVESWLEWASKHHIHPAIYTYIAYKKGETLRSKYDGEKPNADPRKWEMASKMLYATGQPEMLRALVGEDITKEFCQFCNQRVITLEDVLKENYTEIDLQMNTAERYATAMGLSQVDEANFEKVRKFVQIGLGGEPCAIFESLWTHGDDARVEIVAEARLKDMQGGKRI